MTTALEARAALVDALKALADNESIPADQRTRYYDLGDNVDPPGVLLSMPSLTWESHCADPTGATFSVILVAQVDDRAIDYLLGTFPVVVAAIESYRDAVVTRAAPAVWVVGNTELPACEITTEVAL